MLVVLLALLDLPESSASFCFSLTSIPVQSAPPIRCGIPPLGRIGGSFEKPSKLGSSIDLRTFRPDRIVPTFPRSPDSQAASQDRVTSTQRKTLTTHVSSTCSPVLCTFLSRWPVPRSNVVSAGSHRYTSSNASFQNPVFESHATPIPISSGHLLRTLLHPFWVAGLCRVQKEPLPNTTLAKAPL
jgi:hypothetical protein